MTATGDIWPTGVFLNMIRYASNTSILPDLGREVRDARRKTFGHTVIYKSAQASQNCTRILPDLGREVHDDHDARNGHYFNMIRYASK
jgi:hypothetical protein